MVIARAEGKVVGASPLAWLSACFLLVEGRVWREMHLGCLV